MLDFTLNLYLSQPEVSGGQYNTSFSVEPTEITSENAKAFFRYDHTPIKFKGGHCKGENFEYTVAIPFDIDNSHSDNPVDWVTPEAMAMWLRHLPTLFRQISGYNPYLANLLQLLLTLGLLGRTFRRRLSVS